MEVRVIDYRLSVLPPETDEDDVTASETLGDAGFTFFQVPSDDEDTLLTVALEEVGVYDDEGYTIERTSDGCFLVRAFEEPFLVLESEEAYVANEEEAA